MPFPPPFIIFFFLFNIVFLILISDISVMNIILVLVLVSYFTNRYSYYLVIVSFFDMSVKNMRK